MKWCELREYKWNEYVTIAVNRNLSNCENSPKKSFLGASTGFEPVASAVLSQLSYEDPYTGGWPIYWVHQPVKGMHMKHWMKWCELREYKWNEYVTIAFGLFSQLLKLRFTAMVTWLISVGNSVFLKHNITWRTWNRLHSDPNDKTKKKDKLIKMKIG